MTDIERAIQKLKDTPLRELDAIALATQLSASTLAKIKYGVSKSPRVQILNKLIEHFEKEVV